MRDDIRKVPAIEPRVETGAVQFGGDWPGTFIRGDNAFQYAKALQRVLEFCELHGSPDTITLAVCRGLLSDLESAALSG